jgi:hypothetical protein
MSYIVLITKPKEENPNWAPKKLLSELNLGYVEITVKGMPPVYFYNSDLGLSTPFIFWRGIVWFVLDLCSTDRDLQK